MLKSIYIKCPSGDLPNYIKTKVLTTCHCLNKSRRYHDRQISKFQRPLNKILESADWKLYTHIRISSFITDSNKKVVINSFINSLLTGVPFLYPLTYGIM